MTTSALISKHTKTLFVTSRPFQCQALPASIGFKMVTLPRRRSQPLLDRQPSGSEAMFSSCAHTPRSVRTNSSARKGRPSLYRRSAAFPFVPIMQQLLGPEPRMHNEARSKSVNTGTRTASSTLIASTSSLTLCTAGPSPGNPKVLSKSFGETVHQTVLSEPLTRQCCILNILELRRRRSLVSQCAGISTRTQR